MSASDLQHPAQLSPLAGVIRSAGPSNAESAVRVTELTSSARIWLSPFRSRADAVSQALSDRFGCALPAQQRFVEGKDLRLLWADAEGFHAELPEATPGERIAELRDLLGESAALIDKTAMYVALRLAGPCVRDLLAKGCPLDLRADAFPVGSCAPTAIEHCHVHIRADAEDSNVLLVGASFAQSFWHWLEDSALEFGLRAETR